jgi:hypothetical protein
MIERQIKWKISIERQKGWKKRQVRMPKIIHNGLTNKNAQRHSYSGGLGESQDHFAKYHEN